MPSVFVRLDVSLEGNGLSGQLAAQAGGLTSIAQTVAGLAQNPPGSLADLGRALEELPLPDLAVSGDFAGTLSAIQEAVPADLSSITGNLTAGLQGLDVTLEVDVARLLGEVMEAIAAVHRLLQIDLVCDEESGAGGGGAGTSGGTGGGGAGGAGGGGAGGEDGTGAGGGGGEAGTGSTEPAPTGVAAATIQVDAIRAVLEAAPSPFNVEGLLSLLRQVTQLQSRASFLPIHLPIVDDWIDPLQTLETWKGMQPAEIRDHMAQTLQDLDAFIRGTVPGAVEDLAADLAANPASGHSEDLARIASGLTAALGQLRAAVTAADLSGAGPTAAQVQTLLDELDGLRPTLQADLVEGLPVLGERLASLPDDVADRMAYLLSVLGPTDSLRFLRDVLPEPASAADLARIQEPLQPFLDWLRNVADKLDLSSVQEPLATAAGAARSVVDGLEQGLAEVTVQVRAIFGQVESLLEQVDTQALADQVKEAIEEFADQLKQRILDLFQPVRAAVSQVVGQIDGAVDTLDPEQVIDALRGAIESITGVLEDPEVVSALDQIRGALDTATAQIEQLSFAPLTDEVIAVMQEMTAALSKIDTSTLDPALQVALQGAVAVLPSDLTPVTDPILGDFGALVETGPVPLLETVRQQPQRLLDQVRSFDPAALVGGTIGQPYRDLLAQMEAFRPSRLLEPVEAELESLKDRLKEEADPGAPLQLLEEPFSQLLAAFDRFKPEELVKPVEEAISGAVDRVLSLIPVEEVFAQVDGVLQAVEDVVTFARSVVALLEKLNEVLQGLAGSRSQIEAWIDSILDKVEAIGDTAPLAPRFAQVSAALDATRATALSGVFEAAAGPLTSTLATQDAQAKLAALVQAHATFPRPALAALPASAAKDAVAAALNRFDPLDPAFGAPFLALGAFRQTLTEARSGFAAGLTGWDARYHAAGGALASFRITGATPVELRQWVHEALEPQFIRPFQLLLGIAELASGPLGAVLSAFRELVDELQGKVSDLLLGPDSLRAITGSLQALVDRLRGFNLSFLVDSLNDVFAEVRGKVAAVDPAQIRPLIEEAFDEMLDTLSLDLVLPPADVATLDADYVEVIDKLKALDPEKLVVDVIRPEFDARILPLLASFDLTALLTALIERLRSLDEELKAGMERVNGAYREMLDAVPSISLSLDIDVELPF
ncbi:MAG TPA: hypothetical protein VF756_11645 [Thermoanaerobaculia bacterium]